MTGDREERDEELGAAIRQLDVPPAGGDFYPRLLARLEAEAEPGTGRPDHPRWRWKAGSPLGLSAAAAALVIVLIVSWVGLPGGDRSSLLGPGPAAAVTAEEVRQRVDSALAGLRSLTGDVHIEYFPGIPNPPPYDPSARDRRPREHFTFVLTSAGDFRVDGLHDGSVSAYSTARGSQRSFSSTAGSSALVAELTGLATGPPDPAPTAPELSRSLGSLVRSFLRSDADVPVEETTHDGRAAWHLVVPLDENGRIVGDLDVTVDQQTGFPLRVIERATSSGGEQLLLRDLRLSNLSVDTALPADTFVPPYPPGTPSVTPVDRGYRRVQLHEVAAVVGYAPLVPQRLPSGFELAEVAVAPTGVPTAGGNPPSRNVVSTAWQRGFDRVVVTTRATGPNRSQWEDPFVWLSSRGAGEAEPITVSTGAASGGTGELRRPVDGGPHAWVVTDDLVVTVVGDLTRQELLDVLGSLQPAR